METAKPADSAAQKPMAVTFQPGTVGAIVVLENMATSPSRVGAM